MADRFPHLKDSSFPNLGNVDVYKFKNEFDYSRYDDMQMSMQLCAVPWDMGEAHIGNRTISGIGNVVFFESKAKRDKWFADIPDTECYRFETKFKELHRSNQIDVAIPFDVASKYNYLVVDYNLFANDDSPVMYEDNTGLRRWFWFVREVEFVSPNTTKLHLLNDAWQTFIYDLNVSGMMLERGHAPMAGISADKYLADPIGNCGYLLSEDVVNENATGVGYAAGELVFNAQNMKAVVISTANPYSGSFGTKEAGTWKTDGTAHFTQDGVPSYCAFALNAANINTFINNLSSSFPQFIQTIQGICFISSDLLTLGSSFTFASVACNLISSGYKSNDILTLSKSQFGYPEHYQQIAKLYTYPYAYIELTDETGDITEVHIEQTNGKITFESCVNLVFPWLNISGHLTSTGRGSRRTISFSNITDRTMPVKGDWYKAIKSWDVPIFGVSQDAGEYNDFATDFDRAQMKTDADTAKINTDANADTAVSITAIQNAGNTANTAANATKINSDTAQEMATNAVNTWYANDYIDNTTNNTIQADNQRAAIAAGTAGAKAATSAITQFFTGNIPGAIGTAVNGGIEAGSILASNSVTVNQTATQAGYQTNYNGQQRDIANITTENKRDYMINNIEEICDNNNAMATASTSASATTMKANALRTQTAAYSAISNQINQAALDAPRKFGELTAGDSATTKPMGLFADIITQDLYSIAFAGDEMLRYGYYLNRYWEFDGNWNVEGCRHYAYWKLKDFWVTNLNIPDMYVDKIRFFLFGGVTVWRKPEYIGHTDLYDNMEWSV